MARRGTSKRHRDMMARRGTAKRKSQDQERHIARLYGGKPSPSSGAADTDAGDVRTEFALIECKVTGGPGGEKRPSLNKIIEWLEGATREAWEENKDGVVALRVYAPDSILSVNGWLDLSIRPAWDDGERERVYTRPLYE